MGGNVYPIRQTRDDGQLRQFSRQLEYYIMRDDLAPFGRLTRAYNRYEVSVLEVDVPFAVQQHRRIRALR